MSGENLTTAAELALVGGVLVRGAMELALVRAELAPDVFGDARARAVLEAASEAQRHGREVTAVAVAEVLDRRGALGLVGGLDGLDGLRKRDRPGERDALMRRVADHARVRKAQQQAAKIAAAGLTPAALEQPDRYLAAVAAIGQSARSQLRRDSVGASEGAQRTWASWSQRGKQGLEASPTGIAELDAILGGGLKRKRMYIDGARPGVGKSALSIQSAVYAAERGHPQLLFNREMPLEDVFGRAACQLAEIDGEKYERGPSALNESEMGRLISALGLIGRLPIDVNVQEREIGSMLARARVWLDAVARPLVAAAAAEAKPRLLVPVVRIDYLQRCALAGKFDSREQLISTITDMLASFARDEDCAIEVLCQVNRANKKENRAPREDDLRESGAIEADAGVIILLHDEEPREGKDVAKSQIIVAKNKWGRKATVRVLFDGPSGKFVPMPPTYGLSAPSHVEH